MGVVYLYSLDHNSATWSLQSTLTNWTDYPAAWSYFGRSCGLNKNGTALIVGAPSFSPSESHYGDGGVIIFRYYGRVWQREMTFTR